jgi:hypothetical protein
VSQYFWMSCEDLFHDVVSIVQSSLRSLSFFFFFFSFSSLFTNYKEERWEKKKKNK